MRISRVAAIVKKEVRELLRDPISLLTLFLVPVSMMLVFGFGLKLDVKKVPFAVLDQDNSRLSREVTWQFVSNREYFTFKGSVVSYSDADKLLNSGKVMLVLVFPPKFEKEALEKKRAEFQALIDGTFPYRAEVVKSYVEAAVAAFNLSRSHSSLPVEVKPRYWFNESLNQDRVVAVGTLAVVLMISPAVFAALLIVKEKESGSIYNAYTAPITKGEFLVGKLLAGFSISIPNALICLGMVLFIFGVYPKGSLFLLIVGTLLYLFVATAFGLFMSNFFNSQAAAFIGTTVLTIVPSILYSGYLTPLFSMGESAVVTSHLVPAFYYLKFLKGVFFKGVGLSRLWPQLSALLAAFSILFGATYLTFKKRER
ncbi:ABC-2 type transporter [Thermovibrio ammonificans HB-1]|uniref:ABC-2 type transporter n=1 Tax=Thermovibrio ammonificans (strain DSM 15698 / JCM 12110 / HB-1) TaxID=648996 RepID=E8T6P8_THEA1|nr:ABC transporter permease [Thermovibrio ammonificans]ADU96832.1 ABC-2 type transporter [Thermovibrio ammonificans HB-1]